MHFTFISAASPDSLPSFKSCFSQAILSVLAGLKLSSSLTFWVLVATLKPRCGIEVAGSNLSAPLTQNLKGLTPLPLNQQEFHQGLQGELHHSPAQQTFDQEQDVWSEMDTVPSIRPSRFFWVSLKPLQTELSLPRLCWMTEGIQSLHRFYERQRSASAGRPRPMRKADNSCEDWNTRFFYSTIPVMFLHLISKTGPLLFDIWPVFFFFSSLFAPGFQVHTEITEVGKHWNSFLQFTQSL